MIEVAPCERCGERGNVHLTEIINKVKKEIRLCSECAQKHSLTHTAEISVQGATFDKWWELTGGPKSGPLTNVSSVKRGFLAGLEIRQEVDLYEILEPIFLRPAMYFGRKSVTAFFDFYFGLQHLGGCGHGGPFMYKLRNGLHAEDGFFEWACTKHSWSRSVPLVHHYKDTARTKLSDEGYSISAIAPNRIEETGFDLFVTDLKEFREQA